MLKNLPPATKDEYLYILWRMRKLMQHGDTSLCVSDVRPETISANQTLRTIVFVMQTAQIPIEACKFDRDIYMRYCATEYKRYIEPRMDKPVVKHIFNNTFSLKEACDPLVIHDTVFDYFCVQYKPAKKHVTTLSNLIKQRIRDFCAGKLHTLAGWSNVLTADMHKSITESMLRTHYAQYGKRFTITEKDLATRDGYWVAHAMLALEQDGLCAVQDMYYTDFDTPPEKQTSGMKLLVEYKPKVNDQSTNLTIQHTKTTSDYMYQFGRVAIAFEGEDKKHQQNPLVYVDGEPRKLNLGYRKMLLVLVKAQGELCSRHRLQSGSRCNDVQGAIRDIRKLGIVVKNERNMGWRIIEES